MSITYEAKASSALETLALTTALEYLDTVSQQAAAENWSYSHFLGYLLEAEVLARHKRIVAACLRFARFPYRKNLSDFDYNAQPGLDKRLIEELSTGRFLVDGRSVVFLGPPGVGKTHLAIGLGVMTAELGHKVYFTTVIDMARRLTKAMQDNKLHQEMKALLAPKLLIIDEVGYLNLDLTQASLLFQVICKRYDADKSIILTSNKTFSDWGQVFAGDSVMAAAALDRLLHRCTVINIRGESYRLREKNKSSKSILAKELSLAAQE